MTSGNERDEISGVETTGHEWDGIKELNNPLPRWWLYVLYATILWSIGYWILMPAWPLINSYSKGVLGHSQRAQLNDDLAAVKAGQAELRQRITDSDLEAIIADPALREFAIAGGRTTFGDNCAACHGTGAQGAPGYPNLNDDDWIWGGHPEEILATLRVGIRSTHEDTRWNEMPAFLDDGLLDTRAINDIVDYLLVISAHEAAPDKTLPSVEQGAALFAEQCASCHQAEGDGDPTIGAPRLNDALWLYGGSRKDIVRSIAKGRSGVMPHWEGRLVEGTLKQVTVYLLSLGGGE